MNKDAPDKNLIEHMLNNEPPQIFLMDFYKCHVNEMYSLLVTHTNTNVCAPFRFVSHNFSFYFYFYVP